MITGAVFGRRNSIMPTTIEAMKSDQSTNFDLEEFLTSD